jgi:hypothetical protein
MHVLDHSKPYVRTLPHIIHLSSSNSQLQNGTPPASTMPIPPQNTLLSTWGGLEGSVCVVKFVEHIPLRSTNHHVRHLAPWSSVHGLGANPTLF